MNKKLTAFLISVFVILHMMFAATAAFARNDETLLILGDSEAIPYDEYGLYMDISASIAGLSARQGIAFTIAMQSYLQANNVILDSQEFMALCGEDMQAYMESDTFKLICEILNTHYDMEEEAVELCVRENYYSQYIARMLSGFFNAQASMQGGDTSQAQRMFDEFSEEFSANLSFETDGIAVFSGETIEWTDLYENVCLYNELTSRLETADTIACNRSISKFLQKTGLHSDLTDLEQSVNDAVATMKSNEIYYTALKRILEEQGSTLDDFIVAIRPFVIANFERATFGQYCYDEYRLLTQTEKEELSMEDFYYSRLDEVVQSYTCEYLGW